MKSKKKDVLINIKGVNFVDDDEDVIELFTTGEYYQQDGAYFIAYEETQATGFEGSWTTLQVQRDCVVMQRTGTSISQMIIEQGVRHQCHYDVGYGDMMIGVSGGQIKMNLDDTGGHLMFSYTIDFNSMYASTNEMYIQIKENAPTAERTV